MNLAILILTFLALGSILIASVALGSAIAAMYYLDPTGTFIGVLIVVALLVVIKRYVEKRMG